MSYLTPPSDYGPQVEVKYLLYTNKRFEGDPPSILPVQRYVKGFEGGNPLWSEDKYHAYLFEYAELPDAERFLDIARVPFTEYVCPRDYLDARMKHPTLNL